jgi:hypothetical protein
LQPDSLIPNAADPQAFNRFSYVRNNPINFNDPTGHKWTCIGEQTDDHCYDDGDGNTSGNTHLARKTWKFFHDKGLVGNDQKAMEYLVETEFNWSILNKNVMTPNTQGYNLFEAVTRNYNQHCSSGAWSGNCLNNFWAYHQGPLTGANATEYSVESEPYVRDIASAILEPGKEFNTNGAVIIKAADDWRNGCGIELCHYALAKPNLITWVKDWGSFYPDDGSYSINGQVPGWELYMYESDKSSGEYPYFVIMNQTMWQYLAVDANCSDCLWHGD